VGGENIVLMDNRIHDGEINVTSLPANLDEGGSVIR